MNGKKLTPGIRFPKIKKERHQLKYRSDTCLNCYHPLDISDQYCPNCGQLNSTKKLSFDDFFSEFFAGIFAYDSRFYRTLGALLFKPGKISKDYIEGKRVRYANPYRFYLSASIIFFLIWSIPQDFDSINARVVSEPSQADMIALDSALAVERQRNASLDSILGSSMIPMPKISSEKEEPAFYPEESLDSLSLFGRLNKKTEVFWDHYEETENRDPHSAMDSLGYNPSRMNLWLYKKSVDAHIFLNEPGVFLNYFVSKLPFIIFFYLPVFALFIWLLYARRPFTYMEHLIFTFHNQTTWFVLFGLALLLDYVFTTDWFSGVSIFIFLFYLYKAFRRFYGQGRVKTILKFIIINIIFFTLAIIATIFSVLASFAIY